MRIPTIRKTYSGPAAGIALAAGLFAVSVASMHSSAQAQTKLDTPVVLELFTSQGCSSCPSADRLLEKLAHQPGVIAMSLPVDYWDYIGWKDTFASPKFSARQRNYAIVRNDRRVYTPQVLVNGLQHVVGSDLAAIRHAAKKLNGVKGALRVSMQTKARDGKIICDVGAAPAGVPHKGVFLLFRILGSREVKIGRGENHGTKVRYTNIVRSITKIGIWDGKAKHIEMERQVLKQGDSEGWILLLQAGSLQKPGVILAAAKAKGF